MSIEDLNEHIGTSKRMYNLCKNILDKKKQDYIEQWLMEEADTFTNIEDDNYITYRVFYRGNTDGYPIEIIEFISKLNDDDTVKIMETRLREEKNKSKLKNFIIPNNLKPHVDAGRSGVNGKEYRSSRVHSFLGDTVTFTISNNDFAAKLYIVEELYNRGFIEYEGDSWNLVNNKYSTY